MTGPEVALYDANGKPTHWRHAGHVFTEHTDALSKKGAGARLAEAAAISSLAPHLETESLNLVEEPERQPLLVPAGTRAGGARLTDEEMGLLEELHKVAQSELDSESRREARRLQREFGLAYPDQLQRLRALRRLESGLFAQIEAFARQHGSATQLRYLIDGIMNRPVL